MVVARQRLQENFGGAATEYDERAKFQHVQNRRVLDAALSILPTEARVLDVGCGTAMFALDAREKRPDWNILGLDVAAGMCEKAQTRCQAINADALALPFANASFDGVVSSLCYQWVENHAVAFAEIFRVLRPGGSAIIATLGAQTLVELRACAAKADLLLNVLPMRSFDRVLLDIELAGFAIIFKERRVVVQHYESVHALINSMRDVGAGNNFERQGQGLSPPKRWSALIAAYEAGRTDHGIPATWDHQFFVLRKPQ